MNNPLKELSQLHEELDTNPQPQEQTQDSSTTSPDESPAGCGPNRRVAEMAFRSVYADRLGEPAMEPKAVGIDPSVERMEAYVKWLGLEPVAVGSLLLQGQENGPDELVGVLFPIALRKLKEGDLIYSADTIAALTKERDIWAEASKAKAERLTALQAENAELRKNYNAGRTDELAKAMQIIATTPGSAAHHRIAQQVLAGSNVTPNAELTARPKAVAG